MSNAAYDADHIFLPTEEGRGKSWVLFQDWTDTWTGFSGETRGMSPFVGLRPTGRKAYSTLLSESDLLICGLKVHHHQADNWLVKVDADTLTGDHPSTTWLAALTSRIDELRQIAVDEDLAFNEDSASEAHAFATVIHAKVRPSIFLVGNGNIRFVWDNSTGEQIGLQFLGDGYIQYVMFTVRGDRFGQNIGEDRAESVMRIISASELRHLLNS